MTLPPEFRAEQSESMFQPAASRLRELQSQRDQYADRSVPFNVSFLDDIAFGILPVDLVVIGAETGAGKTTLGMLFGLMSARKGLRVTHLALEAYKNELEQKSLHRKMAQLAWEREVPGRHRFSYAAWMHGRCRDVQDAVGADAIRELACDLENLTTGYRSSSFGVEDVEPTLRSMAKESDLIIFDHLHYVDLDGTNENRAMKRLITTMGAVVNDIETPVITIAHLRKKQGGSTKSSLVPDFHEFHGSSEITKVATKVVTLAPARDRPSKNPYIANTYMAFEKDRLAGKTSYVALVGFDMRTTQYGDTYELGRLSSGRDKFMQLTPPEKPWWADNGRCLGAP